MAFKEPRSPPSPRPKFCVAAPFLRNSADAAPFQFCPSSELADLRESEPAVTASPIVPILGVCLGHQAIGQVFGGAVVRAPAPVHGKLSVINHRGTGVFRGVDTPFRATRYHSLVVHRASVSDDLMVTAETADHLVMGLAHTRRAVHGVQFHPESIASEHGFRILKNFLDIAAQWNAETARCRAKS